MSVSYISLLEKIENKIQKEEIELASHLMICLEINDEGLPSGQVVKVSADPYETLGMIDVAIFKLNEIREKLHQKFKKTEDANRLLNNLPKDIQKILDDHDDDIKKAFESNDANALEDLKNKILGSIKPDEEKNDDDTDDDGFNINDFKSGL